MSILNHHYGCVIKYDLLTKFQSKTPVCTNNVKKLVLNLSKKEISLKRLLLFGAALELISYQNTSITLSGNSNLSFKIKKGAPNGCKVILRSKRSFYFLFNLISKIFPSVKQFEGFTNIKSKKPKTFSFKLNDLLNFTEIETQYALFKVIFQLNISIITHTECVHNSNVLLTSLRFPIK